MVSCQAKIEKNNDVIEEIKKRDLKSFMQKALTMKMLFFIDQFTQMFYFM